MHERIATPQKQVGTTRAIPVLLLNCPFRIGVSLMLQRLAGLSFARSRLTSSLPSQIGLFGTTGRTYSTGASRVRGQVTRHSNALELSSQTDSKFSVNGVTKPKGTWLDERDARKVSSDSEAAVLGLEGFHWLGTSAT